MESNTNDLKFKRLLEDPHNSVCVDCGQPTALFASINNGVFICLKCSETHHSLGSHTSLVRSITMDAWNASQIQYLEMGGNKRFLNFMAAYDLTTETAVEKYKSQAAAYYRQKLNAIVEGKSFDQLPPTREEGRKGIEENISQIQIPGESAEPLVNKSKGAMYYLKSGLGAVAATAKKTSQKIKEANIGDKLKYAGSTIADKAKGAGLFVYDKTKVAASAVWDKSKDIAGNEKVQSVASVTKEGVSKAGNVITSIWSRIFSKKKEEEGIESGEYTELVIGEERLDAPLVQPNTNIPQGK